MNIEIACRVSPVRAATKTRSPCTPLVMNSLLPLSTQRIAIAHRARVRMPATSDPAPGSVIATAVISSPAVMRGR